MDFIFFVLMAGFGMGTVMSPDTLLPTPAEPAQAEVVVEPAQSQAVVAAADTVVTPEVAPTTVPVPAPEVAAAEATQTTGDTFVVEDQTPSGKFTTATEVKQILEMTKPQWIAVRKWEGRDLLYFTNMLAWRCGTHQISYAINGGTFQVFEAEPCYITEATPNAIKTEGNLLPYVVFPENSIGSIEVRVLYDDLSEGGETYARAQVEIN